MKMTQDIFNSHGGNYEIVIRHTGDGVVEIWRKNQSHIEPIILPRGRAINITIGAAGGNYQIPIMVAMEAVE